MPYERLEDLRVYQEAVIIGDEIWSEVMQWEHFEKNAKARKLLDEVRSFEVTR